jgi:hypothetical protein
MNKLVKGIVAVAAVVAVTPALAHASDDTTTTTMYEPPIQCVIEDDTGPARVVHGKVDTKYITPVLPDCEDVEGICVEVDWPGGGPERIAHRPAEESEITGVPCVPIDPACEFVYYVAGPKGPVRAAHQNARPAYGGGSQYITVDIPEECQEALSQAFGPTGRESGTIAWIAALLVGVGGVLLVTRRTIAIRTR